MLGGSGLVDVAREGRLGAEDIGTSVDVVDSTEESVPIEWEGGQYSWIAEARLKTHISSRRTLRSGKREVSAWQT